MDAMDGQESGVMAYKDPRESSTCWSASSVSLDRLAWRNRGSIFMPWLLRNFVVGLGLLTVLWIGLWQFGHSVSMVMLSRAVIVKSPPRRGASQLTELN